MGGIIIPPVPGFYAKPASLDDLVNHTVGKILDQWGIDDSIGADDVSEMNYWDIEESSFLVGKGDTIELSIKDLLEKINSYRANK